MKCPVCGSDGDDLVFNFYCSNPHCQNFHQSFLIDLKPISSEFKCDKGSGCESNEECIFDGEDCNNCEYCCQGNDGDEDDWDEDDGDDEDDEDDGDDGVYCSLNYIPYYELKEDFIKNYDIKIDWNCIEI